MLVEDWQARGLVRPPRYRAIWFGRERPVPVLCGYAPPNSRFDRAAPMVSGEPARCIERLAGIRRGALPFHFGALNLFRTHGPSVRPNDKKLRIRGGALRGAVLGRVAIVLGPKVRYSVGLQDLCWGESVEQELTLWWALPMPGQRWYRSADNRAVAKKVLCEATRQALGYGLWDDPKRSENR